MRLSPLRLILWLVLTLPGLWILWRYRTDIITYGQVIHYTGDLAVQVLIIALAATPLRLAFPRLGLASWLLRYRREFGLASFGYAALHLVVYLLRKADLALILHEGAELAMLAGWAAFVLFMPLAITSNDISVRRLKGRWKSLHRLVYPAAVLALAHWVLTAFDPLTGYIHAGILAAIEAARLILQDRRRRVSSQ